MKSVFAVVALAAYSVTASAAPLSSPPTFMPSVTLAVAPLYEISLDASVTELTISDPAMLVLGLRQENPQPAAPQPLQIPFAPAAFCGATLAAFLTILLAASVSLRPTRQVTELIRPMA